MSDSCPHLPTPVHTYPYLTVRITPVHLCLYFQITLPCGGISNATGQTWSATSCLGGSLMQAAYQADWVESKLLQVGPGQWYYPVPSGYLVAT